MSDAKLFATANGCAVEIHTRSIGVERSLQTLFENNLDTLLGVTFLASEYSTGPVHGGRIDTLGIDENGSPVIIEYKRAINENVINQGLFYLDWLLDHKREFQWLVLEKLGEATARTVEWSFPRLICIAGDFTRYDGHAVKQINRSIELLRYRRYDRDLLMIDLIHATKPVTARAAPPVPTPEQSSSPDSVDTPRDPYQSSRIDYRLSMAPAGLRDIWDAVTAHLSALGDDVQKKELKLYVAFKRIKNFACLELFPKAGTIAAYLKVDPGTVTLEAGFTRDVRNIGHFGTGDLEVVIRTADDVVKAHALFQRAYDGA